MSQSGIVTVFGSRRVSENDPEYRKALETGRLLAQAGFMVCNGGYGGIMEASARGAAEAGGKTLGLTTEEFSGPVNQWIQEERKFKTWSDRLFGLIEAGDAYLVFDGGTGTLTELFVVWEMSNKKMFQKPVIVMGPFVRRMLEELGRIQEVVFNPQLKTAQDPEEALRLLQASIHADRKA